MKSDVILTNEENQAAVADEILKATALVYFKDALLKQEYESCKELADLAKKFGAQQSEIREVIASYLKEAKLGNQNEAKLKTR